MIFGIVMVKIKARFLLKNRDDFYDFKLAVNLLFELNILILFDIFFR